MGSIPTIPVKLNMAVLVKWLTHWFVDPAYVGSIPTYRPSASAQQKNIRGGVAKW